MKQQCWQVDMWWNTDEGHLFSASVNTTWPLDKGPIDVINDAARMRSVDLQRCHGVEAHKIGAPMEVSVREFKLPGDRCLVIPDAQPPASEAVASVLISEVAHVIRNALVPAQHNLQKLCADPGSRVGDAQTAIEGVLAWVDQLVKRT